MKHLTQRDSAEARHEPVIERRPVRFAEVLPRPRAEERERDRLEIAEPIGTGGVEVESPMIGVREHVRRKGVLVPLPPKPKIAAPGAGARSRPGLIERPRVDTIDECVDGDRLTDGHDRSRSGDGIELCNEQNGQEGCRHGR